jgi:putative AdoMet-dependent methyltransferase
MGALPAWHWNEIRQVGTDYSDVEEVERYDQRMGEFRDLAAENEAILAELSLPGDSYILEIGTGTGHFARAAARAGHRVRAIDVSKTMLRYAESRAKAEGLTGIEFSHAGFLTSSSAPATFDAAVSVAALHHLPDLWKAIALQNVHRALKPGGRLVLGDVVFSWDGSNHPACFDAFVDSCPEAMRREAARHIAEEYSTLRWIMEGLLVRAGFRILRVAAHGAALVHYLCEAERL